MRRKRRDIPDGEYSDPLKDYSPPQYADELERSLADDEIGTMKITPFDTISPDTTIGDAMAKMASMRIAALLVADGDRLAGIFTERDVLDKVAGHYDRLKDIPVSVVMTPDPVVAYTTEPPAKALNLMAIGGFRHVPVLDVDDKLVGVLGPRRVTAYLQERFAM